MKKEFGIARCGLACCLCSENESCPGCLADGCAGKDWCEIRKCAIEKGVLHCFECENAETCGKGILAKQKPKAFTLFAKKYGAERLLECLERNERNGIVYHRNPQDHTGDYDVFSNTADVMSLIENGKETVKNGKA